MTIESMAIITSAMAIGMCVLALILHLRSPKRSANRGRTLTITIEDSSGVRARVVTRSNRRVDEVKRDFERLVAQPSRPARGRMTRPPDALRRPSVVHRKNRSS